MVAGLARVAPTFMAVAASAGRCAAATVTPGGLPALGLLRVEWNWDGQDLRGRITARDAASIGDDLASTPAVALLYRTSDRQAAVADCVVHHGVDGDVVVVPRRLRVAQPRASRGQPELIAWSRLDAGEVGDAACWAHLLAPEE